MAESNRLGGKAIASPKHPARWAMSIILSKDSISVDCMYTCMFAGDQRYKCSPRQFMPIFGPLALIGLPAHCTAADQSGLTVSGLWAVVLRVGASLPLTVLAQHWLRSAIDP